MRVRLAWREDVGGVSLIFSHVSNPCEPQVLSEGTQCCCLFRAGKDTESVSGQATLRLSQS